jgi:4-hydroxybenzoate polyprenyltransferase
MDSSAPSGQANDPFPANRVSEWIGILIALLTLTIPLIAVASTINPVILPDTPPGAPSWRS